MQAATIAAFGDIDVLDFGEIPTPSPKAHHVLIKIAAVGTNYYDTLVRSGAVSRSIPLPHVVGSDIVGHVERLGATSRILLLETGSSWRRAIRLIRRSGTSRRRTRLRAIFRPALTDGAATPNTWRFLRAG